ncbi:MAG TPA: AraC family transcriptional regulator [Longimicrobium sp.]|nr:AraC family transcriptional regulator [Longimicrobium sp.]
MSTPKHPRTRACLWDGGLFGVGPGAESTSVHAHHAHQLSISVDGGPVRFRTPRDGDWRVVRAAVVAADRPHAFDGTGATVAMIFIDPGSYEGRWLGRSLTEDVTEIPEERIGPLLPRLASTFRGPFDGEAAAAAVEEVVRAVCRGPRPGRTQDPRILQALAHIHGADAAKLSLAEVARTIYLSPSRFAHLFTREVGLPFRRYLLWRRVNRAMARIGEGRSFTEAAYEAGFADSAHLTRTFRQMFGLSPSRMTGTVDFHEMPTPFARPATPS